MNPPKNSLIRRFLLIALLMGMTGCQQRTYVQKPTPIDTENVMQVVIPYAVNLEHEKQLRLEDSSVAYGRGGLSIQNLRLNFISQSILELREARELIVDVTEGLVDGLNNNPELMDFFVENPLTSKNLEICIKFESYLGLYVDKAYIHWIMLQNDNSYFYAFDLTNEFNLWNLSAECWHQRVEPYFKSRQIVNISRLAEQDYQQAHPKPQSLLTNERYEGKNKDADHTNMGLAF